MWKKKIKIESFCWRQKFYYALILYWIVLILLCMLRSYFTHIDGIYFTARMLSAYVCTHVRHVFRAVSTVRTIESRRLAAFEFRMIVKIILVTEDTRTLRTGKLRPLDKEIAVDGDGMICRFFLWHDGHEFMPVEHW